MKLDKGDNFVRIFMTVMFIAVSLLLAITTYITTGDTIMTIVAFILPTAPLIMLYIPSFLTLLK